MVIDGLRGKSIISEGGKGGLHTGWDQVRPSGGVQMLSDDPIGHRLHFASRSSGGRGDCFPSRAEDQSHELS